MLTLFGLIVNIILIGLIFLRIPRENVGLAIFTNDNNFLSSFSSAQKTLNIVIGIGVIIYFMVAFQLNIEN